jgi:competence protein ComEC
LLVTLAACFLDSTVPFLLSLSLLFYSWGGYSLQPFLAPGPTLARYAGDTSVTIEGVVHERPEGTATGGQRLLVRVERLRNGKQEIAAAGVLLVQVKEGRAQLATGDRIVFSAKIREPRRYGLPGEVDYPRQLAYQNVFATAFLKEADDLLLVRSGEGWRREMDLLAGRLGRFIDREVAVAEAGVLKALLLGDRGDVPDEVSDAYALSGVNHILSISGFHIGIIFLSIFHLLFIASRGSEFLALRFNLRKSLLFAALPVVLFYLLLSGGAAATLRSVIMIAAVAAALQLKREVDPVNAVLLAACCILFLTPQAVFDLSFQLSFLAIWGLVTLAPLFSSLLSRVPQRLTPLRWLCLLLAASAAAIMATLVPVAYYFHQVSLVGLLANLIVIPLMGYGAVVAGFASLPLITIFPACAEALIRFAAYLVRISDIAIAYFARAPMLTGYTPGKLDFLLACLVLCALSFLKWRHAGYLVSLLLIVILTVRAVPAGAAGDGMLHVTFLSVGQGDATLVRLPDGKYMLVDGGGRAGDTFSRVGERLLLPALRRLGVRRIDYLVLSHEHPDHLQGVLYLAACFEIGEFWESGIAFSLPEYLQLKWLLSARGIPVRTVNASLPPQQVGGAWIDPLWPPVAVPSAGREANETSLVLRLRHGKSAVLLTGDIGVAAEGVLVACGAPLESSLLKVAHHGSKYSSTDPFLAAVSPKAAVISAGHGNPFHLPAPVIVQRVQRRGIRLYRTDQDGTVEAVCRSDGAVTLSTPWGYFN